MSTRETKYRLSESFGGEWYVCVINGTVRDKTVKLDNRQRCLEYCSIVPLSLWVNLPDSPEAAIKEKLDYVGRSIEAEERQIASLKKQRNDILIDKDKILKRLHTR